MMVDIITVVSEAITIAGMFIAVYQYLRPTLLGIAAGRLFDTLKHGKSIATKAEVRYQIRYYIPPRFICEGTERTIRDLLKELKKANNMVTITGKAASGKTTTMRYLYCRLSRARKCVYIQMQSIHSIEDFQHRVEEQKNVRRKKDEPVTAFIDGVDEALAFQMHGSQNIVEAFTKMFLNGRDSEIYRVFAKCSLNLDSVAISLRPEFLESLNCLKEYVSDNIRMHVYQVQKMEKKDIIKIYKSLKVLRRYDRSDAVSRHQDSRYPPIWKERRYTRLFRKILDNTPDSVFYYPMYVRYAYSFMREYEDKWHPYMQNLTPEDNMALSFKILLDAIFKWEFHIYYCSKKDKMSKQRFEQEKELKRFKYAINECLERVIEVMPKTPGRLDPTISRKQLEDILENCAYGEFDQLVIAHCVLSSDDTGQYFGFCHSSFYEYYLSGYLLDKGDYKTRKQILLSPMTSDNLRRMYYSLLCQKGVLSRDLYASICNIDQICDIKDDHDIQNKKLNLEICLKLQKAEVFEISDDPVCTVTDILAYFPFSPCFVYHGVRFARDQVENIMDGTMDLCSTKWKTLEYVHGLAPCDRVKELSLYHLPLLSVQGIQSFINMMCLDIRMDYAYKNITLDALKQLGDFDLACLYISSDDGSLCTWVQDALDRGDFCAEKIFVEVSGYSAAHVEIYRLKCDAVETGKKDRFYLGNRASVEYAKKEYQKSDSKKELQLLKAVFELEADETGPLGLQKRGNYRDKEIDATLWAGMSLAKYYQYLDSIDEDESAYKIYLLLEHYIEKKDSELSVCFGFAFAKRLTSIDIKKAKEWIIFADRYASHYYKKADVIKVKINLYRICVHNGDKDLDEIKDTLQGLIEQIPSYKENSDYYWFIKICCCQLLRTWKKGMAPPESLSVLKEKYLKEVKKYAEQKKNLGALFSAIYVELIYMNRTEQTDKTEMLLNDLAEIMSLEDEDYDERVKQRRQIQYLQQKLYYLFVSGQRENAVDVADELLEYPLRTNDISKGSVQYIRDCCVGDDESYVSADKHRLWSCVWY